MEPFLTQIFEQVFLVSSNTVKYVLFAVLTATFFREQPENFREGVSTVYKGLVPNIIETQKLLVYGQILSGFFLYITGLKVITYVLVGVSGALGVKEILENERQVEKTDKTWVKGLTGLIALVILASILTNIPFINSLVAVYLYLVIFIKI